MKVTVDSDRCVGNGVCEAMAPELFEVAGDGQTRLLVDEIPTAQKPLTQAVVESCPALALHIVH